MIDPGFPLCILPVMTSICQKVVEYPKPCHYGFNALPVATSTVTTKYNAIGVENDHIAQILFKETKSEINWVRLFCK